MTLPFRAKLLVLLSLVAGAGFVTTASALPPERVQGSARFMSGGVGSDEAEAMRQAASNYPLSIELAARPVPSESYPRDVYLANVRIDIRDQQGQSVISTTTDGPILLASLPPGRYTINAQIRGQTQQKTVTIGSGSPQRVLFEFAVD